MDIEARVSVQSRVQPPPARVPAGWMYGLIGTLAHCTQLYRTYCSSPAGIRRMTTNRETLPIALLVSDTVLQHRDRAAFFGSEAWHSEPVELPSS